MATEQAKAKLAELDATLAEVEAQGPPVTVDNSGFEVGTAVSQVALNMADDKGVRLADIKKGSGAGGKIIVPDVEKFIKVRDEEINLVAEAEVQAESDAEVEQEKVDEAVEAEVETEVSDKAKGDDKPAPKKRRKKAGRPSVPFASALPLHTSYAEVMHIKRTLNEFGYGWVGQEIVTREAADENLGKLLQKGFVPIHISSLGVTPDGIQILWVFGKPDLDETPRYNEMYHVVRNVGGIGPDGHGISGFDADAMVTGYLEAGWDLAFVDALAMSPAGINIMWIFVR